MIFHVLHVKLKDSECILANEFQEVKKQILRPPTAYEAQIIVENFQKLKIKEG